MHAKFVLLPGDGIGPEIVTQGRRILEGVAKRFGHTFEMSEHLIGGCAIDGDAINPWPGCTSVPAVRREIIQNHSIPCSLTVNEVVRDSIRPQWARGEARRKRVPMRHGIPGGILWLS